MTLNLTEQEMVVLELLAKKKDLTKTGVVKLALRLLHIVDTKVAPGKKLLLEDEETCEKSELIIV